MKKMKLVLTGLAVFALVYTAPAAPSALRALPPAVSHAFSEQYPGAKLMNWESRSSDYIVNFRSHAVQSAAYYTKDGTWLRTSTKVADIKDLPDAVQNGFSSSRYGKYNVETIEKVQQPASKTMYVVTVDYGGSLDPDANGASSNGYMLYFDKEGQMKGVVNAPAQVANQ